MQHPDHSRWLFPVLALIAGALVTLSLAPFDLWPLTLIASATLYYLLFNNSARRAAWLGWLFGLALFTSGTSWVYVSIHDYGAAAPPLAALLTLFFVAGLALFLALFAWLWVRFFRQPSHSLGNALSFAALWVAIEVFRGWFLTGFPWLYLGYSQLEGPLAGYAPLGGVWLLSFVLVLSGVLLLQFFFTPPRNKHWLGRAGLLLAIWVGGMLLRDVHWTTPTGQPLSVAIFQGNVEQNLKWDPEQLRAQLNLYRNMTLDAPSADLLIWPETAIPVLQDNAQDYLQQMHHVASQRNATLITGIPMRHYDEQGQQRFYNGITTLGQQGSGEYLKQKLVPFGEYVPLQDWLRGLIEFFDLPMSDFARGPSHQAPLEAKGYRIAPYICYEVVYPEFATTLAAQSDILLTISNDTWFGRSIGPLQHLQMAQMRALEAGRWMIRATNNGVSALITPQGQIHSTIPQFEQAILRGHVVPMQGLTPYLRFGSWPLALLTLLLLGSARYHQRRHANANAG